MALFWSYFVLAAPLFCIVLGGYLLSLWRRWRREWTKLANQIVFAAMLPALLFRTMSKLADMPRVDARLLLAFFGSCVLVFLVGRWLASAVFRKDAAAGSIFGLAGVFSNNLLLGVPIAKLTLGDAAMPSIALVLIFNALTLWTLLSVSVEWSRHGALSVAGFSRTALAVVKNPIVIAILSGTAFGFLRVPMPRPIGAVLDINSTLAAPASLLVLGMGLAGYSLRQGWCESLAICALKLVMQPLCVWALALLLGLPPMERNSVVLLASLAVGANVYLMAVQYETMQGTVASSLVISTLLAGVTTPMFLTLVTHFG